MRTSDSPARQERRLAGWAPPCLARLGGGQSPGVWATPTPLVLLMLVLLLASCSSNSDTPTSPSTPTANLEQQTFAEINEYRVSRGLTALTWNEVVANQARQHSQNMASGTTPFGHDGFNDRVATIRQTIPWSNAAENVAVNTTVSGAVGSWLNSAGHRANIEGHFDLTGVGTATAGNGSVYFTQIFVKRR